MYWEEAELVSTAVCETSFLHDLELTDILIVYKTLPVKRQHSLATQDVPVYVEDLQLCHTTAFSQEKSSDH